MEQFVETYIDGIVNGWAVDITGNPVHLSVNGNSNDVLLPDAEIKHGDVVIDTYAPIGQAKFLELTRQGCTSPEARREMREGVDFTRKIVPYDKIRESYGDPFVWNNSTKLKYVPKKQT